MFDMSEFPTLIDVSRVRDDLDGWVSSKLEELETTLNRVGALLFRGTGIDSAARFESFVRLSSPEIPQFTEESSPRSVVEGEVLTSTDYPNEYPIQFHSEYSYAAEWPRKLHLCCLQPAQIQGETPIANNRIVLSKMRDSTRARFENKGVLYVRNYRPKLGVSWQAAFRTPDERVVEKLCKDAGIEYEWRGGGVLRTRQIGEAILKHPKTGQEVWFNHGFFFNVRSIEPLAVREMLMSYPEEDPLSTNTLFGDGSPIGAEVVEELRDLYASASSRRRWEPGDVLVIDNMLTAHARAPYQGKRQVVVVMTDRIRRQDVVS